MPAQTIGGRLDVQPYKPEGGFEPTGVVLLLAVMLATAVVTGFAAHLIGRFIYLILLFPVGIGFAVGFAGSKVTTKSKVRSPLIGGLLGFVCGVAAMLCMHYFDYRSYLDEMQKGEIARIIKMFDAEFESGIAEVAAEDQRVLRLT
ncbi:MAG: hypothetical protein PHU85_03790, partial [Phycisphaerae bacterium]|nr:hypothetical protein [Phycisphaerae bacterium]